MEFGASCDVDCSIRATIALPMTAASANSVTVAKCSAFEMPKPTAMGKFCKLAQALDQLLCVGCQCLLRARDSGARDRVDEALGCLRDALQALVGTCRCCEKNWRELMAVQVLKILVGFFDNHVGYKHAIDACLFCRRAEPL